jgi:hypothetical protein
LSFLENECFHNLFSLTDLDLSNNFIELINVGLFSNLFTLTSLFLNGNPIKLIENESFLNLVNLKQINLNSTPLGNTTDKTFSGFTSIREVTVHASLFSNSTNVLNLKANLYPKFAKNVLNVSYYNSINIIFYAERYTERDCFQILYFGQHVMQLNLKKDWMHDKLSKYCGQYERNQGLI